MDKLNIKKALFCIAVTMGLILSSFGLVKAALPGDEGLTLSPPLKEITIAPGDSSVQTLKLTNPTNKLVELYPKAMDFNAKGESGEPGFSNPGDDANKYSLANWITLSQNKIALTPEQVVEFKYQIDIPNDAEPGGHYGVVFFATEPPELTQDSSKVALSSMVGGLVLVKVPGDIIEEARIEEFNSDKLLYLFNKVKITTRIKNLGNVHFKPTGSIRIKNMIGRTVDTIDFNVQNGNVLPESTRKFENQWNSKKILIGPYKATADFVYGSEQKPLTETAIIWIIPWWLLVILAVVIVLIIILIIRKKSKKGKNKGDQPAPRPPVPPTPPSQGGPGPQGPIVLR